MHKHIHPYAPLSGYENIQETCETLIYHHLSDAFWKTDVKSCEQIPLVGRAGSLSVNKLWRCTM